MLFVSFLRHSPINSHFAEGNNFGGLVLFFSAAKAFFRALSSAWHSEDPSVHYPLRMGLARRRWCVYWPPNVAGTGSIFRGCESEPKKPSPRHDTGKGTLSSGVFTPVSGLFFKYVAGAAMFLYVETFFNVCASVVFGEHMC